jgi:hypothetical protein
VLVRRAAANNAWGMHVWDSLATDCNQGGCRAPAYREVFGAPVLERLATAGVRVTHQCVMPCSRQTHNDCGLFTLQHMEALYRHRHAVPWDSLGSDFHVDDCIPEGLRGPSGIRRLRPMWCRFLNELKALRGSGPPCRAHIERNRFLLTTDACAHEKID